MLAPDVSVRISLGKSPKEGTKSRMDDRKIG